MYEKLRETEFRFRPLRREELDIVLGWAALEGWNPGRHDAEAFWAADPEGFFGIETGGELIGSVSMVAYENQLGFVGLFIVQPDWRERGLGTMLWKFALESLRQRLDPAAALALDGVFTMQPSYARSGFAFSHRNLRMQGVGQSAPADPGLVELSSLPFAKILEHDRTHFGVGRPAFLEKWIDPPGGRGLAWLEGDSIRACGVIRPCVSGFKIGPLFAEDPAGAERVFTALSAHAAGQPIFLDTPENNPAALALAARHGLTECFGCARMATAPAPALPWEKIYGVTTFELG